MGATERTGKLGMCVCVLTDISWNVGDWDSENEWDILIEVCKTVRATDKTCEFEPETDLHGSFMNEWRDELFNQSIIKI